MKKKNVILALLAAGLVLTSSVGSAWAYFTTYVEAQGGVTISLGDETDVEETFSSWTKHVSITIDPDSEPVFLRARAFCGTYELYYGDSSNKWTPGEDGYYYYSDPSNLWGSAEDENGNPRPSGEKAAEELLVQILDVPTEEIDQKDFNVIVVYETVPVKYDDEGKPYADWNGELDIYEDTVEGGGE